MALSEPQKIRKEAQEARRLPFNLKLPSIYPHKIILLRVRHTSGDITFPLWAGTGRRMEG
jgi:hypothetical protein